MAELLPTQQSLSLVEGLTDYLKTTFALSDDRAQEAIEDFLTNTDEGMFKGPYVRLRLPFEPASGNWRDSLDFYGSKFTPYGHQAKAFERLSSKNSESLGFRRPLPTLVTTGTGSGKTESFLYPILDHVLRAQKSGITGIKALILYPMNALANDQAGRLAQMLSSHPELSGIRAALYTGQEGASRTTVSANGLISDRYEIRKNPPDILLTNYKMLDMLLLRHEDSSLWKSSATSLQYLVLDEFHTYDGAQGTDVAMLLRRLGLALKAYWPENLEDHPHGLAEEDRQRPLGRITPVATSATLGGTAGAESMLAFAETIFGEALGDDALVTESRMPFTVWREQDDPLPGFVPRDLEEVGSSIQAANAAISSEDSREALINQVLAALFETYSSSDPAAVLAGLRHHPLTEAMVAHCTEAIDLGQLAGKIFPRIATAQAREFLSHVLTLFSHVRAATSRQALGVETHLWVREVSRIESALDISHTYRWGDDGVEDSEQDAVSVYLPAIYCRHCGKNGWGTKLAPTGTEIELEAAEIRAASLTGDASFRALMHAANEADAMLRGAMPPELAKDQGLRFLHTVKKSLDVQAPVDDDQDFHEGRIIPVQTHVGLEANELSRNDVCPSCLAADAIRFVGSAVATLTSVAVSNLFGAMELDAGEKKALVFTDSVQDAAHRAGFIQARSHTFNLRNSLRNGFAGSPESVMTLAQLVDRVINVPADENQPVQRFKLVPPELADRDGFKEFWDDRSEPGSRARAQENVKRRLAFDAALELGLQGRLGRTLELTGSVVAEVDAGTRTAMAAMARRVWDAKLHVLPGVGVPTEPQMVAWVRGVLVRIRLQGGIHHPWMDRYIRHDGARFHIWTGRPRHQGMPAFPKGRPGPAFPVIGPSKPENGLDPVTPKTSWYALWTSRALGVSTDDAGYLARALFEELARQGALNEHQTDQGARVYSIPPERIMLQVPGDKALEQGLHTLECTVCRTRSYGTETVINQLESAPCQQQKCTGSLARTPASAQNFYRGMYSQPDGKRVVAHEHTSLLPDALRLEYEDSFKSSEQAPDAPNVLVATPTLEMGIDIGDLSCVMLASMPGNVASYVQRVGRAGRLTGNSLAMAFVRGRGEHLPKLYDPLSVINGEVRPPSTYLQAEEILARQFTAYLGDLLAADPAAPHPRSAREALKSTDADSFLGHLLSLVERRGPELLQRFLTQFSQEHVAAEGRNRLAHWVSRDLPGLIGRASRQWIQDNEDMQRRIADVEQAVDVLEQEYQRALADYENDGEHPKVQDALRDLRSAQSQLKGLFRQAQEERSEYWISRIERYGLFPNYTLIGEPVTLDVGVSWRNEESQQFEARTESFARGAGIAIHELAPGATFYAQGMEILVDAVDLGPELREVEYWQICPACGWKHAVHRVSEEPVRYDGQLSSCPRCSSQGIEDVGHIHAVVVMRKVSAEIRRDEAQISDARDERTRTGFHVVALADIDPGKVESRWFEQHSGFGVEYLSSANLTWLNLGPKGKGGISLTLAGEEYTAPRFLLCEYCGKLDGSARSNGQHEHRFWCRYRKDTEEHARSLLLARELDTQAVNLHLPLQAHAVDIFAMPTLRAAFLLGSHEHLGGVPGQLGIIAVPNPADSSGAPTMLIHDTVPGGTGYLASFKRPENVFAVLRAAYSVVSNCVCAREQRRACHRCLLPYAEHGAEDLVSRVEAERLLAVLLGIEPGEEPDIERWDIKDEPVERDQGESVLEISFRQALKQRLMSVNADIQPVPGPNGEKLNFRLPGQRVRWQLEPQVDLGGTRPDFVLKYEVAGIPAVAIYTDGRAFHASVKVNRVGDDAVKRYGLKLTGTIPWAITDQDLRRFSEGNPGQQEPDQWVSQIMLERMTGVYSLAPDIRAALGGGSMELLWAWIANPDLAQWQKLGDLSAGLATGGFNKEPVAQAQVPDYQFAMERVAPAIIDGPLWWERQGRHVHLLAAGHPLQATDGQIPVVLSLDDRPEALAAEDFAQSWRRWLYWSNLLAFRSRAKNALVATASSREEILDMAGLAGSQPALANADLIRDDRVSVAWEPVMEIADDEQIREFIHQLSASDVPVPDSWGDEIDGVMAQLAWTSKRIVVTYDQQDADALAKSGWTAIASGDAAVVIDAHHEAEGKE